ncbi:MAG TPA: lytic murein transglycosylase B [Burkholderiaceae bacterium]|nr:lytic murein transglycosylase B [Burkholderiaceae bacterium]
MGAALTLALAAPTTSAGAKGGASSRTQRNAARQPLAPPYGLREDVQAYIRQLAESDTTLDRAWLEATVGQARFQPQVARLIMPPPVGVPKNWQAYRDRFIEPRRIDAGLAFWDAHAQALAAAQARWGVPPELVVGIIGVETFYGRHTGGFRAIDALATLAFDFPSGRSDRSGFFRDELTALLQLARRQGLDLQTLRGSYAGALGWGQFMPSSWTRYGLDFDGDGEAALDRSPVDAIGSVAHFLAAHGWERDLPTHLAVEPPDDPAARAQLLAPDIRPSFTAMQMQALGAKLGAVPPAAERLALVELQNGGEAPTYIAGTQNFWVVTRYNWSAYYAMAVIELGRAIAQRRPTASP